MSYDLNRDCLDIGIIQAFLDGELRHDETARVTGHIAICDACALMLTEAEEESAFVFPTLEREFDTLVPTQRLWNKINESITTERESRPFWHKAWAFLTISLASPSMAAAASLLLVIGVFTALWINRSVTTNVSDPSVTVAKDTSPRINPVPPTVNSDPIVETAPDYKPAPRIERTATHPQNRPAAATPATFRATAPAATGYLPGEESYVRTISTLNKTVDGQKDGVLRPSERISYERDMAVVNDTITGMRTELKRNPKNESAKQVLYSSYQNKIDLLNSVAQKQELVASLR